MSRHIRCTWILIALLAFAGALFAQVAPERSQVIQAKSYHHPDLKGEEVFQEVARLPTKAALDAQRRLVDLGIDEGSARLDARSGRFATLLPTVALIPGEGYGNTLKWSDFGKSVSPRGDPHTQAAWQALYAYLAANQEALQIDVSELTDTPRSASHGDGNMIQFFIARQFDGIPVRDSNATAVIKKGNLMLLGFQKWGNRGAASGRPKITEEDATAAVREYLAPLQVDGTWGESEMVYLTLYTTNSQGNNGNGQGYRYQPAWAVRSRIAGDGGSWETLVDAYTGEVLSHEDLNQYAEAKGGVYPVTNDGVVPDGNEHAGWPMPFMFVGSATTDTGGNYGLTGSQTATFNGPYVNMADQCGTDSLTQSGGIDWGTSGGDDCTTPGFGGAGNTHASRSGFYELNRIKEMARAQLPSNTWLQNRLTANMNINNTCNAFWNGSTVNFYRSGGGCANTGEIAAVFDHEWGHGMDANDVNGGIASPSGEGIADIYSALRLNDSCIGRNFRPGINCSGYGDPCLNCTGVRDIDYLKRASGNPHTYTWSNANCGGAVHCVGSVYAEAMWSLWKRKLQQAPFNYDNNTAHEITTRLSYLGAGVTSVWFSGGPPNGGCSGSSGYMNYLAADDDDGNLNNGTPHMTAIYSAFNDQQIACQTPTPQNSGCGGGPTSAPNVTATPGNNQIALSWGSVSGASSYEVFRAEGIFACDFGKVKIAEVTGTSYTDTGLQNGRDYSYTVIAKGPDDACFGPASSCDTAQPAEGPECTVNADCDDGLFCNGSETCVSGSCVAGSDPCPGQGCDEVNDVCTAGGPCTHAADFEGSSDGWTNGNDTCTTGFFVVGSPNATDWQVSGGNPGSAYYTQPNSSVGVDDVDGGTCEALSPLIDCNGNSAADISIDYFHGQRDAGDDPNDGFSIEVLSDGVVVDTIVAIGDVTNTAAWSTVTTTINNPGDIQIRVRATDAAATGDIVEGGIDNVSVSPSGPQCTVNADCDDGLYCNGAETCNAGTCQAGTAPTCDDGVSCTVDTCNESTDSCDFTPDDGLCDNGLFCDGAETCNATLGCQAGTAPDCNDGVSCTVDSCNEGTDSCDHTPNDAVCDNGLFCDGAEVCNVTLGCQDGPDPCSGSQTCNETTDTCEGGGGCTHSADFEAGAGGWTNGNDTCTTGHFVVGSPDATAWQVGGGNPGNAYFTAPNPGGVGTDDVDNGTCEALSPTVDCNGQPAASISLDYFHGQRDAGDDSGDGFTIEVLNNGAVVDTIVSIGDVTNTAAWTHVSTTVTSPGNIQLRVRATDAAATGDIVEGGIDNVSITPTTPPSCVVDDDFEGGAPAWTNDPASTCTTGDYVTGNPTNPSGGYQIVGSHSGSTSIFSATNSSAGVDDIDGGNCILRSPSWSVPSASTLSVWYWFGQRDAGDDAAGDFNILEYSTDNGATWTTLASNGDSTVNPAWTQATASIPAGSTVQLRMQCSDGPATGDLVECGIDDFSICN